ncbi:MAG TPA: hypothetical protein VFV27_12260 [Nevskiaceae bacterium]|nr:hypothetical protein [Nevskiaceae bacterium]
MTRLPAPRQWEWSALLPIAAGLYALTAASGWGWWLFAGLPGWLVLASGTALLLMPGDPRITSYLGLGAALGLLLALPAMGAGGFFEGLFGGALFAGSFLVAGRVGLEREPLAPGAPAPLTDLTLQAKAGLDEAVLGFFLISARVPSGLEAERMCEEALALAQTLRQKGWIADPAAAHATPEAPRSVQILGGQWRGQDYEKVSFDSGYCPDPDLPGAARWANHGPPQRAHARVLRHAGEPRPWLICIHGYRMGTPLTDFSLFPPAVLHQRLGLNLLMPTLPLHGERRIGRLSGDHYLDGDLLDLLFAQSQALWDLRRWVAWIRSVDEQPRIGVYGISLGGYNTALLSQYEAGLDFVLAGIPVVDLATALWRFLPPAHRAYFAERGLDEAVYREVLTPVSPLARPCLLEERQRHLVAATGDRIVVPAQPLLLERHWGVPLRWYQGSHLSIRGEREVRLALREAMDRAGWRQPDPVFETA